MIDRARAFDRQAVAPAVGVPALVGVAALLQGYPLPRDPAGVASTAAAGVALGVLGLVTWWSYDRGHSVATATALVAVGGAIAWSLLSAGITTARVGDEVVIAGLPVLARFAAVTPWVILAVGVVALVERVSSKRSTFAAGTAGVPRCQSRRRALGLAAAGGATVAVLALVPAYLSGSEFTSPALLGFALGGGFLAATVVGYLFVRHRILTPVLVFGVVAAAATVSVIGGGSLRGFPAAWPVWFLSGLFLGGFEAGGRRIRRRLRES